MTSLTAPMMPLPAYLERTPEFLAWAENHGCDIDHNQYFERVYGHKACGRCLFLYTASQRGIRMMCGAEYWTKYADCDFRLKAAPPMGWEPLPVAFRWFVLNEVRMGYLFGQYPYGTKKAWPAWSNEHWPHGGHVLEICSAHTGGYTRLVCSCGATLELDIG